MKELLLSDKEIIKVWEMCNIWRGFISRCYSSHNRNYPNYGGRGITVCERWMKSPVNFIRDMWPRPDNTSIDRINNDGEYSPANCRWATKTEQGRNRRVTRFVKLFGKQVPEAEVAETYGIKQATLRFRIESGWTPEQAVGAEGRIYPLTTAITYGGETLAFKDMAKKHGLTVVCLKKRLASGMSLQDAMTKPRESRGGKVSLRKVILRGEEGTIKGFAQRHGQDHTIVYERIRSLGWTLEQALGLVPPPPRTAWNKGKKTGPLKKPRRKPASVSS